jgi:hypothetical protein
MTVVELTEDNRLYQSSFSYDAFYLLLFIALRINVRRDALFASTGQRSSLLVLDNRSPFMAARFRQLQPILYRRFEYQPTPESKAF